MTDIYVNTVEYSTELLKKHFPKGSTVWLVIRQVSRSGMYRHISCHSIQNNELSWLSFHVANVLKWTYKDKTMSVASVLYGDGYALKERYI